MELRKIQRTSGGTFFVCLPKGWAERSGLDRGSSVAISETADGRLVIDAKYGVERAPQVVVIKPTPFLDREIIEKYLLGYDVIRVEAKERISPGDREQVKQASSRLIGLEIIEEDYSRIVLQSLLEPSALPPEKILRREYSIASGMHRDAVTALIEGDVHLAENVIARDNEVNRLYFLLVRILRTVIQNPDLSEKLEILPIDCLDYRLTASLVEAIGDQSAQIAEKVIRLGGAKITKELSLLILKLSRAVHEAHENALRALFSRDVSVAEAVRAEREAVTTLFSEIETIAHTQPIETVPHILAVVSSISRIYDHSVDIADLVMPRPV
ncbi:MAG: phosphate uptake regulator PhoU [Candidatus Bathyarchaeia archaeon]